MDFLINFLYLHRQGNVSQRDRKTQILVTKILANFHRIKLRILIQVSCRSLKFLGILKQFFSKIFLGILSLADRVKNSQSLIGSSLNTTDSSSLVTSPSNHSSSPHSRRNISPISYTTQVPSPITSSSVNSGASMFYQKYLNDFKSNSKNSFVVPNFLATSSAASSVITSSGNGSTSHASNLSHHMHSMHHNYPHVSASQMSALNNSLYHSPQIMSPAFSSNSPNHTPPSYYYESMIPTTASLNNLMSSASPLMDHPHHNGIKLESITPHILHSSSSRQDSYEEDLDKSKILDMEQKHIIPH